MGCVARYDVCLSAGDKVLRHLFRGGSAGSAGSGESGEEQEQVFLLGLGLALASVATSGAAGVVNEYVLKIEGNKSHSFWQRNRFTYQWGLLFNLFPLMYNFYTTHSDMFRLEEILLRVSTSTIPDLLAFFGTTLYSYLFSGFTWTVWFLIAINTALGISISLVFRYFDNVTKSFGGPLILFCTTFFSWLLFDSHIGLQFVLALVVYSFSVYLYADWRFLEDVILARFCRVSSSGSGSGGTNKAKGASARGSSPAGGPKKKKA